MQEEERWIKPYKSVISERSRQEYAASITHMDAAIGNIVAAVDRTGQKDRTVILFFSDNGAVPRLGPKTDYEGKFGPYELLGDNGPLRGWIGDLYDGCLRTPAFIHWPGVLEPRVVDSVVSVLDWYPTLAKLAGSRLDGSRSLEGQDIWPVLTGTSPAEPGEAGTQREPGKQRELYWKTSRGEALRHGDWKLVVDRSNRTTELFRMDVDPNERDNLTARFPKQVQRLRELLDQQIARDPKN